MGEFFNIMSDLKPTDISRFYKQLDDFKNKLLIVFKQLNHHKEIEDINKYYEKLLLIKKTNVRSIIELLYSYGVATYATQILTRDERFFLGQLDHLNQHIQRHGQQTDVFFLDQIKIVWSDLRPQIKQNIWDYIQVICWLAEKIIGGSILANEKSRLNQMGLIS